MTIRKKVVLIAVTATLVLIAFQHILLAALFPQVTQGILMLSIVLLMADIGVTFVAIVIADRVITGRLVGMTAEVRSIGKSGDRKKRVREDATTDEISQLAHAINNMLDSLEYSQYALVRQRTTLPVAKVRDVILLVLSDDGTVKLINDKGSEMLGYPANEIIGKNWFDGFIPEHFRDHLKEAFYAFQHGDTTFSLYDNPVLAKNGSERHILWHNELLKDDSGKIVGVSCSGEDITKNDLPGPSSQG